MVWTFNKGNGRVFGTVLGHYYTTFEDPLFRVLVLRGMAWAAGERWQPGPELPSAPVAIGACASYEQATVTRTLAGLLDQIGGLEQLVAGKWVTIKVNLTGQPDAVRPGWPELQTYQTHFILVLATADLLQRAGARQIRFVESLAGGLGPDDLARRSGWDWGALAAAGGQVSFENTHNRGRFDRYARLTVPWGGYVFPAYDVNRAYEQTDIFVSLAKLKEHATDGVCQFTRSLFALSRTRGCRVPHSCSSVSKYGKAPRSENRAGKPVW